MATCGLLAVLVALISASSVLCQTTYTSGLQVSATILRNGNSAPWNAETEMDSNPRKWDKMKADVCSLLSGTLSFLASTSIQVKECVFRRIFGHPDRGRLVVSFGDTSMHESEVTLVPFFAGLTAVLEVLAENNRNQGGRVLGEFTKQQCKCVGSPWYTLLYKSYNS
ncbi:unnamed protein product [Dicrocoelium dendriticum]|nr:unnamed protein product [Dicrocoelium dendriticum]